MTSTKPTLHYLKISGLGYTIELDVSSKSTLLELRSEIEKHTQLLPAYQRLVCRGLKLNNEDDNDKTLTEIGVKDRTKIILMHSPLWANEKETYEALMDVQTEIDDLKGQSGMATKVLTELVTRICCKLDAIEISSESSPHLRLKRKELLRKAEEMEQQSQQQQLQPQK